MKLRQHARLAVMKGEEDEEEEEEEARSDFFYKVRVSLLLIHYGINTNVRNRFTIIKASVFYFRKQQDLISSQKRRRLEEKARIEGRMKLRQHARLAVMKVEEDEEEEEEEARSFA
ncbi:hypothetical protein DY000_02025855 [Brassica cretica]|uniref:Uncharacterized protein n=1 Tax=Brassica cretica TaxID=69181 RepID=A0ABQ7E8Z9_BRACR|nr:hypothetical protein DY000_02025855 [Brassica cretica]